MRQRLAVAGRWAAGVLFAALLLAYLGWTFTHLGGSW